MGVNNNNIIIDDGSQEYTFTNKQGEVFAKFTLNGADTGIVERYENLQKYLEGYELEADENNVIDKLNKLNEDLIQQFNLLLNQDTSNTLFMRYTPTTLFANGDMFCEVAFENIGKFIEQELNVRIDKKMAKIRKATAKNRA